MNLPQLFSFAYEALKERRLRASLTVLMVVMGASLIIALDGTGNGFTVFINNQFSTLGTNVIILQPRTSNFKMDKAFVNALFKIDDVKDVIPYVQQILSITSGGEDQSTIVVGVEQSKLSILFPTISIQFGDYVSPADTIGILLGSEVAHLSSSKGAFAAIGQTVKAKYRQYEETKPVLSQRAFNVRGILDTIGSSVVPVDQMVFISLSAANSFLKREGNYDGVYVVSERTELNSVVERGIRSRYGADITVTSPQSIANVIGNITSGVYLFIGIVASVSLLVASVGIITTLHTSMMERIREIGLLKALGFNSRLILAIFLDEAMIIGIVGGSLGVISGIGLSYVMSAFVGGNIRVGGIAGRSGFALQIIPSFSPVNILSTWLLCVSLSMIAGFYPAWRASRLDPVVALRHE